MAAEEAKRGNKVAAEEEEEAKNMEELAVESGEVAETREEEVKGEREEVKLEREEVELKSEEAAGEVREAIETSGAAADAVEESKEGEIPKEDDAGVIDEAAAVELADETSIETSEAAMEGKEAEAEQNEGTLIKLVDKSVETSEQHEADVAVEEEEKEAETAQGAVVMDTADEHNESEAVEEGSDVKVEGSEANDVKVQGYEGNDVKVESCEANVMDMVDDAEKLAMEKGLGGEVEGHDVKVEGYEASVTDMVDDTMTVALEKEAVDMVDASIETEAVKEGQEGLVEEGDEVNVADKDDAAIEKEAVDEGQEGEGEQGHKGQVEEGHEANVADMVDETIEVEVVGEEGREEHEQNAAAKDMVDETIETTDALEDEMEADPSDVADNVMEETTETDAADDEMDAEDEVAGEEEAAEEMDVAQETSTVASGGKRKRGRKNLKQTPEKALSLKKEEDVCFICFDGGELVLCDRRGCPKAYHPSCVNRDEAFFQAKGRWNCGWHLCSNCEKNAHYMCYTCTFSLCKACIKDAVILCVKGNKGFCETCMKTVMLVEKNKQDNKDKEAVDFDDRGSWEFLFKDYWLDLKQRLCLTLDDLAQAKNPWKRSAGRANKQGSPGEPYAANSVGGSDSDNSENLELTNPKRRKANSNRMKTRSKGKKSSSVATGSRGRSLDDNTEWASKELLEFVMHMRNGDDSSLSQFDVQALLLEYINRNKCRDPRRKCQIICDSRLQSLFGKPRVGHFEMLKLLESHFLVKEDSQVDDLQGSVVDTEGNQLEADGSSDALAKPSKDKKRRSRKKGGAQSNVEDFAAIDIHNISLIYLRRNLVEDLLDDMENFQDKVAGAFVRIRISGSGQKQDLYRLVQVIGTCKAAEPYKVGKRTTDTLLEILNLNKTEIVTIDIISNQEFTEDECKRLRQSIKCGLINRLTVGDVQEKSLVLQAVRVKDWLETETVRLTHLRDRASEKGRRKELRECVEKLQLLKTPEERQRRLEETIEIHADPNMDPSHESEEDEDEGGDTRQESYTRPTGSGFGRKGREPISPRSSGSSLNDSWSGTRNFSNMNRDLGRNMSSKGYFNKAENISGAGEIVNDTWSQGRETPQTNHWGNKQNTSSLETGARSTQSVVASESSPTGASENLVAPLSTGVAQSVASINETEKIWHYQDPHGKIQGPFSMVQLRKWNNTGYFPPNLRVWKNTEKQEDAVLVTDAIAGKFQKDLSITKAQMVNDSHLTSASSGKSQGTQIHRSTDSQSGGVSWGSQNEINSSTGRSTPSSVEVSKYSADGWGTTNLPSPTPSRTPISGAKRQAYENNWSPTPGGNGTRNDPLHGQVTGSGQQLANASMKPVPDVQNLVSNLQNLVQSVTNRTTSDNRAWGSGSVPGSQSQSWGGVPSQKIEPNNANTVPAQHSAHGYWANAPPANNGTSSINNTGNSAGNLPTPGFSGVPNSDNWRAAVPAKQSYIQPPAQPQPPAPWGMGVADNQSGVPRMGQENQNSGWVPATGNPSIAWGGSVPGNTNMNWVAPNQGPGWAPSGQGPVRGNAVPSWAPPGQGPPSASANHGWSTQGQGLAPGQGPPLGNVNPAWSAPVANQTQNGDRFSNQRDQGSWNRQPSFGGGGGGGSSRPPFKGQRVCRYYENGHCKKGASCDYLHPDN